MGDYSMHIYGHRGAAGEAPENTIAGCRHGIERGVKRIEIDLRLSADNELVVVHDKTLNRTTDSKGNVSSLRATELGKLDGRGDGPPWPRKKDTGVPTLDKLLDATPELEHYQLEVKSDSRAVMGTIAELLAERFPTASSAEKVVITSSNKIILKLLGEKAPHLQRGIVATNPTTFQAAYELKVDYFCMHWSICHPYFVKDLKRRNIKPSVWTVNDPTIIKNLHKMKVHSIITDYPSMAIPLVGSLERT
jgi:glycerophosphoryl diester phosphodiesterase